MVGKSKILCGVQGWDESLPVCEVVTCDLPPVVEQGTFSPKKETYKFKDVVQYSCQNGYTLDGSKSLSCSEDGTFVPAPPKCIKVHCGDPVIENAKWVDGSRPPYGYKAKVKYQCNPGYVMTGPSTLTCEMNSQWSPGLPECKESNNSNVLGITLGVLGVIVIIITACGCYHCGFLAFIKKKQRSRRDYPGEGDAKEGEAVALS